MKPVVYRKRATALILTSRGFLFVESKNHDCYTPGGGVEKGETVEQALVREVKEELNLDVTKYNYLFQVNGNGHEDSDSIVINQHYVFVVSVSGSLKLHIEDDVKGYHFYTRDKKFSLTRSTQIILTKYYLIFFIKRFWYSWKYSSKLSL